MTVADAVLAMMWMGITAYAIFGGADFGGGFWDLFAGGPLKGRAQRRLIEESIGPVWEANHVWLIFALVVLWTGFSDAFAAIASTLYIPLTGAALGVILRGSAFAFRKSVVTVELQRVFGATFALSSVLTPFFLGTVAGAVASGRVPPGNARGDILESWVNPTSILGGVLAVLSCAYLAAVYLSADAQRRGDGALADQFRARALISGAATGAVALGGIGVLAADAPELFDGLTGRALPLAILSAIGGLVSLALVAKGNTGSARVFAALAVAAIIWGWGAAQYPNILEPTYTIEEAAAPRSVMLPLLVALVVATILVVPALALLFLLTQRGVLAGHESNLAARAEDPKGRIAFPAEEADR